MLLKTDRDGNDSVPMECRWRWQQSVLHCIRTVTIYLSYITQLHDGFCSARFGRYMEDKKVDCVLVEIGPQEFWANGPYEVVNYNSSKDKWDT